MKRNEEIREEGRGKRGENEEQEWRNGSVCDGEDIEEGRRGKSCGLVCG